MTSPRLYDVLVAGQLCLDIFPAFSPQQLSSFDHIITPGRVTYVGPPTICSGGPVANTGLALTKLGLRVAFSACVGDDTFGRMIVSELETKGDISGVELLVGESTGYSIGLTPRGIDRAFLHHMGTNDSFSSQHVSRELCSASKILHLGYPPHMRRLYENGGEEFVATLRKAKDAGVTTTVDMVFPAHDLPSATIDWINIMEEALPHIDIFLPSVEEIFFMLDRDYYNRVIQRCGVRDLVRCFTGDDLSRISQRILDLGAKMTGIKTSYRGFYFRTGSKSSLQRMNGAAPAAAEEWSNRELWCPAYQVDEMVSSAGSGDASIAGFLASYLRGYTLPECLRAANLVGYHSLQGLDATGSVKSWAETTSTLEQNPPPIRREPVHGFGWNWHDKLSLFVGPNDKHERLTAG